MQPTTTITVNKKPDFIYKKLYEIKNDNSLHFYTISSFYLNCSWTRLFYE